MVEDEHRGTFASSDAARVLVEELQFTLGEGPCIDTYRTGQPVLELISPSRSKPVGPASPNWCSRPVWS